MTEAESAPTRGAIDMAALAALALPVLAGIAYQAFRGAPPAYAAIDGGALLVALGWIAFGPRRLPRTHALVVPVVLLALFALPLATGPHVNHVARWLPLGPFALHAGMLVLPLLLRLAAERGAEALPLLLAAVVVTVLQPDAASAAAITFGAVGVHHVTRDWRFAVVAIVGFVAMVYASLHGELAPQPFVERVLVDAAGVSLALAVALAGALAGGFALLLFAAKLTRAERFAVAGALFGFAIMALMNTYPTPLIGYGAAPVLGFALALAPYRRIEGGEPRGRETA